MNNILSKQYNDNIYKSYWQRLIDITSKYSIDQLMFIEGDSNVVESKRRLFEVFNSFIFDKYKEEFASIDKFKPLCDDYMDKVISAGNEYNTMQANAVSRVKQLEEELALLKSKINIDEVDNG